MPQSRRLLRRHPRPRRAGSRRRGTSYIYIAIYH
jgi:hypothetical protein